MTTSIPQLTKPVAWQTLEAHYPKVWGMHLRKLFADDPMRGAAWQLLMPVLNVWTESTPRNFPKYAAGSWGPKSAGNLLARDGHVWRPIA